MAFLKFAISFWICLAFSAVSMKTRIHLLLVSWGNKNGIILSIPQAWTLGIECWFYLLAPFPYKTILGTVCPFRCITFLQSPYLWPAPREIAF